MWQLKTIAAGSASELTACRNWSSSSLRLSIINDSLYSISAGASEATRVGVSLGKRHGSIRHNNLGRSWKELPDCLAAYFTWPQVTLNRHARVRKLSLDRASVKKGLEGWKVRRFSSLRV